MIRAFLNRWAARRLSAVAHEQRVSERDQVNSRTRQLRAELGLPALEIFE